MGRPLLGGDSGLNWKLGLIGLGVGILVIVAVGAYLYLTFIPHNVTTTLTGYDPSNGNVIAAGGGQPAR